MTADTVLIRVKGRNRARLADRLRDGSVGVFGLKTDEESGGFSFSVRKKDLSKTFAILDEMCYTYDKPISSRYSALAKSCLCRLALIVSLAVFAVFAALSRGYVWRISIEGNSAVPDKVIESALSDCGVGVGKKLSGFDKETASRAVREIDGIKLASVYRVGTTVKVEVFESEPIAPPVAYFDSDILSDYDATVTRVVTREGTPLVHPGQNVFKGAPLIGAYRTNEEGNKVSSRASGKVYGTVAFTESVLVATERYEQVAVKSYERTFLSVFGLTLGKAIPSGAGIYTSVSSRKLNAFIPVTVTHVKVTETELRKTQYSVDELAEKAEKEITAKFIDSRVTSSLTVSRSVTEAGGGVYRVNIFIQAETLIGGA